MLPYRSSIPAFIQRPLVTPEISPKIENCVEPGNCGRIGGERNRAESERQEVALSKEHKTEVRQGCRGQLEGTGR